MTKKHNSPPKEIDLVYREVGKTHVFIAPKLRGFHIGSSSLEKAFGLAIEALGQHVTRLTKTPAAYQVDCTFSEFRKHLSEPDRGDTSVVTAKRSESIMQSAN